MTKREHEIIRLEELADNLETKLNSCITLSGGDIYLENDIKKVLHDFGYYRAEAVRLAKEP